MATKKKKLRSFTRAGAEVGKVEVDREEATLITRVLDDAYRVIYLSEDKEEARASLASSMRDMMRYRGLGRGDFISWRNALGPFARFDIPMSQALQDDIHYDRIGRHEKTLEQMENDLREFKEFVARIKASTVTHIKEDTE